MIITDEIWFYEIHKWLSYEDLYHLRFVNKKWSEHYCYQVINNLEKHYQQFIDISIKYDDSNLFFSCIYNLDKLDKLDKDLSHGRIYLMFSRVTSVLRNVFESEFLCKTIISKLSLDDYLFSIIVLLLKVQLDYFLYTSDIWITKVPFLYLDHFKLLIPKILHTKTDRATSLYHIIFMSSENHTDILELLRLFSDYKLFLPIDFILNEKKNIMQHEDNVSYDSIFDEYVYVPPVYPYSQIITLLDNYPYVL